MKKGGEKKCGKTTYCMLHAVCGINYAAAVCFMGGKGGGEGF
jgi:hypothetical protein